MSTFLMCGPAGGTGGKEYNDANENPIKPDWRINNLLMWSQTDLDGIQVVWMDKSGRTYNGEQHYGGGGKAVTLTLESDEYIKAIQGCTCDYWAKMVTVKFLEIETNKKVYKYGKDPTSGQSRKFRFEIPDNYHIVGFFGGYGERVDSIGIIYQPRPTG